MAFYEDDGERQNRLEKKKVLVYAAQLLYTYRFFCDSDTAKKMMLSGSGGTVSRGGAGCSVRTYLQ